MINNAIDAAKLLEDKWVELKIFDENSFVVIQVRDSGSGIPVDVAAKLFDPFFTTKPVGEGTGLGLPIVKGILDEHKAKFEINHNDEHTCFEIQFKIMEVLKMPFNIVYIDDEEELCEVFSEIFSSDEIKINAFTRPEEGIDYIQQNPPDLIVLDYRLPGTTGDEIALKLDPSIPKILSTGEMQVKTKYEFYKVIFKPYKIPDVMGVLDECAANFKSDES